MNVDELSEDIEGTIMVDQKPDPEERDITFVPGSGSVIGGMAQDKPGRVTEAMQDMKLIIDGMRMQLAGKPEEERWAPAVASFARSCSVFLRKTVVGDFGRRETRLLDDRLVDEIGLRFHRLRKIPRDKRRRIQTEFGISGGVMAATKLDDKTLEPGRTYVLHAGSQLLKVAVEWPLPGAADWTGVPSDENPWLVSPDQLFQTDAEPRMDCDEWLGQQVVLIDGNGISLQEMIRTVVNFEGAHSINTSRLSTVEGEKPSKAAKNPAPHILNAVTLFGTRYAHLIVIESAMYIYEALLEQDSIKGPKGDIYSVKWGVECNPEQARSPNPNWLRYQGSMMISWFNAPTMIRYEIKAAK